eukprot:scaffold324324_cov67-Tisochrysis_lutea.AAC.1
MTATSIRRVKFSTYAITPSPERPYSRATIPILIARVSASKGSTTTNAVIGDQMLCKSSKKIATAKAMIRIASGPSFFTLLIASSLPPTAGALLTAEAA